VIRDETEEDLKRMDELADQIIEEERTKKAEETAKKSKKE